MTEGSAGISSESLEWRSMIPSVQCVSSRDLGWRSLLVDVHSGAVSSDVYAAVPTSDLAIGVALAGSYVAHSYREGRWRVGSYHPGSICVHRPGEPMRYRYANCFPGSGRGAASTALLYLPRHLIVSAAEHVRRPFERSADLPVIQQVSHDPTILHVTKTLILAMHRGVDDFYAEGTAAWLAVHLLANPHSGATDARRAGRLSDARLARVIEYISVHFAERLTLDKLANEACISKYHFVRVFRSKVGQTPYSFITHVRLKAACGMLADGDLSVAEVAARCGYPSAAHFSTIFTAHYGITPSLWRTRHDDGRRDRVSRRP